MDYKYFPSPEQQNKVMQRLGALFGVTQADLLTKSFLKNIHVTQAFRNTR